MKSFSHSDSKSPGGACQTVADEMLEGAEAIAEFLGLTQRQVYWLVEKKQLPVIRLGRKIRARKSALVAHLEKLEEMA